MVPGVAETWWRKSFRRVTASTLRALPIPDGQKWRVADIVADRLESPASPHAVVPVASGFKMLVDLGKSHERRIYYSGQNDPRLTRLFRWLLAPGDTVIDGGANIGYHSLLAARCVGEYGVVHAFEPVPQTCEILNQNIRLNGVSNIRVIHEALAESRGELCLAVPVDATTGKTLDRLAALAQLRSGSEVTVPACTLDEYAERAGIASIKLVKLDIEGSEMAAIAGMRHLLSKHRISYLVCELNLALLDKLGISYSAMRETLHEHGYGCYFINYYAGFARMEHMDLVDTSHVDSSNLAYGEYLFAAPGVPIPGKRQ